MRNMLLNTSLDPCTVCYMDMQLTKQKHRQLLAKLN